MRLPFLSESQISTPILKPISRVINAQMGRSPSSFHSRKVVKLGTPDNEQFGVDSVNQGVTGGVGGSA